MRKAIAAYDHHMSLLDSFQDNPNKTECFKIFETSTVNFYSWKSSKSEQWCQQQFNDAYDSLKARARPKKEQGFPKLSLLLKSKQAVENRQQ